MIAARSYRLGRLSMLAFGCLAVSLLPGGAGVAGQEAPPPVTGMHRALNDLLDVNVRDGFVYYRALQSEHGKLDAYVASLDVGAERYEAWPRDEKVAFWLNAYNAFVLKTVVDRYPIRGRSADYPQNSIRQIHGAFDGLRHRAAGRSLTLDEIERELLALSGDPRVIVGLGRGAVGSARLRSEAFVSASLDRQLADAAEEFGRRERHVKIDAIAGAVAASPLFSWRERDFVEAYAGRANPVFATRSPIERAILAFVEPHLLPLERQFVLTNKFQVTFQDFDWRLNDLSGGRTD